jgi:hypothetical protein
MSYPFRTIGAVVSPLPGIVVDLHLERVFLSPGNNRDCKFNHGAPSGSKYLTHLCFLHVGAVVCLGLLGTLQFPPPASPSYIQHDAFKLAPVSVSSMYVMILL